MIFVLSNYSFNGPFKQSQFTNLDEVPLLLDMTSRSSLEQKGTKKVTIRATNKYKVRAVLVLCYFTDGRKLLSCLYLKIIQGSCLRSLLMLVILK